MVQGVRKGRKVVEERREGRWYKEGVKKDRGRMEGWRKEEWIERAMGTKERERRKE